MRTTLLVLLLATAAAAQDLPRDIAAAHPSCMDGDGKWVEGKWKIRKSDLYRHLVRFYRGVPEARLVLPDYMRQRLIQDQARRREITVTDREVERWIERLDNKIRKRSSGTDSLASYRKKYGMGLDEFQRRGRLAVQRERVARAIVNERDKTRDPQKELEESTVVLVIDELYTKAEKTFDPEKLPRGIVARIGKVEVTAYQYGRELSFSLPATIVLKALNDLIMVEEVKLLTGNDDPPSAEELAAERKWFVEFEMNRLRRYAQAQARGRPIPKITERHVEQALAPRGLTLELALSNPASRAQARARGHFRRGFDEARLREYYEKHKDRFSDQLKLARILIAARAQPVGNVGRKIRTLQQGRTVAEAVHQRAVRGADFGHLAVQNSDDVPAIAKNGGLVPFLITAVTPGYQDSWRHANALEKEGAISKPFFSAGRGYVIVKLLERKKAFGFEAQRRKILSQATEEAYRRWRDKTVRKAVKSKKLLEK